MDLCKNFFGVEGEVSVHHPGVVTWLFGQYLFNRDPSVFSEVEYRDILLILYNPSGVVHVFVLGRELCEE